MLECIFSEKKSNFILKSKRNDDFVVDKMINYLLFTSRNLYLISDLNFCNFLFSTLDLIIPLSRRLTSCYKISFWGVSTNRSDQDNFQPFV